MNIVDYIVLGCMAVALVVGILKGFLKQIFAVVGVFVVAIGTSYLSPYPEQWLASVIENDSTRSLVALIATFIVLALVYGMVTALISKLVNKVHVLGTVNRILGAVLAVAVVYLVFAVIIGFLLGTSETFLPNIKKLAHDAFAESWVANNIYKNNFFGDWLVQLLGEKTPSVLPA